MLCIIYELVLSWLEWCYVLVAFLEPSTAVNQGQVLSRKIMGTSILSGTRRAATRRMRGRLCLFYRGRFFCRAPFQQRWHRLFVREPTGRGVNKWCPAAGGLTCARAYTRGQVHHHGHVHVHT